MRFWKGQIDPGNKSPVYGARHELKEETNDNFLLDVIQHCHIGLLRFIFDDDNEGEMAVYIFHLNVICNSNNAKCDDDNNAATAV
eukprot:10899135-Ditylum_brightwellii.AAC.1